MKLLELPQCTYKQVINIVGQGGERNLCDLWIIISELHAQGCLCGIFEIYETADAWEVGRATSSRNAVMGVRALVGGICPLHQS